MLPQTRERVKNFLKEFVGMTVKGRRAQTYSIDSLKREYPFQSLFFFAMNLLSLSNISEPS